MCVCVYIIGCRLLLTLVTSVYGIAYQCSRETNLWGTPDWTSTSSYDSPSNTMHCFLFDRKFFIQLSVQL